VVIDPADLGATMIVAPGRMIDSFLSIPEAESLPLYRMVLKLACVCHIGTKRKLRKVSTKSFIQRMIGVRIADSAIQILDHV
jgi:hypothetical protein